MSQPFDGVKVVDLTHVIAGPFASYQLAVLGAEVIKIEPPDDPDMYRDVGHRADLLSAGLGDHFLCHNANKRSLALDLTQPDGQEVIRRLIATADVVISNYRGGVLERLGLDYESVRELQPNIIHCTITGFGRTGPKADHPAYDVVVQAFSGMAEATGTPDVHPVRVGPAVLDYGTGAQAAFAIAAALYDRERTGEGRQIDVAMADSALMLMSTHVMEAQVQGRVGAPNGNHHPQRPGYAMFDTADRQLYVGAFTVKQTERFWRAVERMDLADEVAGWTVEQLAADRNRQFDLMAEALITRTADEWEVVLMESGVPAARVRRVDEAIAHDQIASRQVLQPVELELDGDGDNRVLVPVAGFEYSHGGPSIRTPPPRLGRDSRAVLAEMNFDPAKIESLINRGIIVD